MALRHLLLDFPVVFYALIASTAAIPASLVEEIKSSELRNNKVKRAHPVVNLLNAESNSNDHLPYFDRPTAIKRGINPEGNPRDFLGKNALPNVSSSLFRYPDGGAFDEDKTLREYEKGYRYGTGRDALDEALENAVLKSELYGDPTAINQYRYYGTDASKRRRRRDADKLRLQSRLKRQAELSPDEVAALLSLYEANQRHRQVPSPDNYRHPFTGYGGPQGDVDENWLEAPVLPHADLYEPKYYYNDDINDVPDADVNARNSWRGLKMKRRPADPTRELRYLNGPSRSDFYTLSQLLSDQKSADNAPVYRRLVL